MLINKLFSRNSQKVKELALELQEYKDKVSKQDQELYRLRAQIKEQNAHKTTSFISQKIDKIQELESEVLKQKQRVKEATHIAQEANEVKYEFISNIRHEVRTPMNSILAFADMLVHELTNKTHLSYAKNIFKSGHKLLEFMDSIIELSRLESGVFELNEKALNIHQLVSTLVHNKKALAYKKGLELTLEIDEAIPESLILDGPKVEEILNNIIDNAIKFTHKGFVKVTIDVDAINVVQNSLAFSIRVEDSGVGIDSKNHQKIFEIFEKHDYGDDVEFQGTGLGLSINKKLAQLMDGDISVSSRLGEGSIFTFSLKNIEIVLSNRDIQEDDISIDFALVSPEGANVMLIDENDETQMVIQDAFANTAVNVFTFDHPRKAIESLSAVQYDLIFIDINILSGDDNAVSKVLAKMSKAPVVTLTSVSLKDIEFIEGGAKVVGHLKTPLSRLELFKTSINVLNSSYSLPKSKYTMPEEVNEFKEVNREQAKLFLQEYSKNLAQLFSKALATNDLNHMKIFSQELLQLATKHNISPLILYAKELLNSIENFDIDAIDSMMNIYKTKIRRLQSL